MNETISIPINSRAKPLDSTVGAAERGHVLVVDDEEANRILLRDPLEAHGYQVSEAVNGLEALVSISQRLPDTVLLDLMMPGMNGFQVCRRLKQDPRSAHVPILMVTALSDRKERLLGIEAGANDFLNKPVDIQDLLLRVGNSVRAKSLFDQLQAERERSERLLLNTLPECIAERMKNGETTIADQHPEVSVLLADLVGFTSLAAHVAPEQIVGFLNEVFSSFDLLAERRRLEKIKTIGDGYMVAGGVPVRREDHAQAVAALALEMRAALNRFNQEYEISVKLRIGISSGPVVAGVIGRKKFAYDIWGETVNTACRLESGARPGEILVSQPTYEMLKHSFIFDEKRILEPKGRG
ncbi:MAG: adenylate/guanylate cyclase domain-containing protein, partial [Limisphaerales bacterium]